MDNGYLDSDTSLMGDQNYNLYSLTPKGGGTKGIMRY
jgi:hypothetical protein